MKLHRPIKLGIIFCTFCKNCSFECVNFINAQSFALDSFFKNSFCITKSKGNIFKSMVRKTAAVFMEKLNFFTNKGNCFFITVNSVCFNIRQELNLFNIHKLIRTECWKHFCGESLFFQLLMVFQIISRVICCTNYLNI